MAVKKAHQVMPTPCPKLVTTPYIRPLVIVFVVTSARLGPGEIAPKRQTMDS